MFHQLKITFWKEESIEIPIFLAIDFDHHLWVSFKLKKVNNMKLFDKFE
jgi:hypothetical protein